MSNRDERQVQTYNWIKTTFGDHNALTEERLRRFFEEAVELVQAGGMGKEQAEAILNHVYSKPVGDAYQEAGGVGICLLGLSEALGFSADKAEQSELQRVQAIAPDHFRRRHNLKVDAGISVSRCDDTFGVVTLATKA